MRRFYLKTTFLAASLVTLHHASVAAISYEQDQRAEHYAKDNYRTAPNYFLATKAIRTILSATSANLEEGSAVLDFGCGPGTLSAFYNDLGFNVTGVDISPAMIESAAKNFSDIDFRLIEKEKLPFDDESFAAAFTSFVLLEMGDPQEIVRTLKEIKRVLKPDAPLVVVTTTEDVYRYKSYNFIGARTDFVENDTLVSGGKVKLQLNSLDFAFEDYFWSDDDYRQFFADAGFATMIVANPLGTDDDEKDLGISWLDEKTVSPISVYLVR